MSSNRLAIGLVAAVLAAGFGLAASARAAADTTPPTAPGSFLQDGATRTSVTVTWAPSTDDVGVTGYRLFRGATLLASPTVLAGRRFTIPGLVCGTSYDFTVDAHDAAGNHSERSLLTATTADCPADTRPPTAPGSLRRTAATPTSLTFAWNAAIDLVGVTGYAVYLDGTRVDDLSADDRTFTFDGLDCARGYQVAADAVDAAGNRSGRATVLATTAPCPDLVAPTAPATVALLGRGTPTTLTLTWTASTDSFGVRGYGLYLDGDPVGSVGVTRSFIFRGLVCGESRELGVDAYDAAGNRSGATVLTAAAPCPDTTPPDEPPVSLAAATATAVKLTWTAPADAVAYGVYRGGVKLANLSASGRAYTFTGLVCGHDYVLAVDAVDAAGNRSTRAAVDATTGACPVDRTPPSSPTLTATRATTTSISVVWTRSYDGVGVTGYALYVGGAAVATAAPADPRTHTFAGLACGRSYQLGVDAVDAAGNRSLRRTLTARTAACR